MKPVDFEGANVTFAKDQPEYQPLPAHRTQDGQVISCWALTWRERLRLLVTGRLYLSLLTFGQPLQPQLPSVTNPVPTPEPMASCIGCGCRDSHACDNGCEWLVVDYEVGLGVCSNCPGDMALWQERMGSIGDRNREASARIAGWCFLGMTVLLVAAVSAQFWL